MRKYFALVVAVGMLVACGKKHPVKVFVDPSMSKEAIEKVAVFSFASSLHHTADPDQEAPRVMDQLFREELGKRQDYKFTAPASVTYVLEREGMTAESAAFLDKWVKTRQADPVFLERMGRLMQVDAVLVGVVDLWQRDEVDYRENATPTTYVGATITIIGTGDGKVLFQASDEDFIEMARSEDRTVMTSGLGSVQNDPGAQVFRAPDPREVALRVCRALASSIPTR